MPVSSPRTTRTEAPKWRAISCSVSTSCGRPARLLATAVQEQEAVGVLAGVSKVVHRAQHRQAAVRAERGDQFEHLLLRADVQGARRLVEEEQRRVLRDRARENGSLTLASAERAQPPVDEVGAVEARERRRAPATTSLGPGLPA